MPGPVAQRVFLNIEGSNYLPMEQIVIKSQANLRKRSLTFDQPVYYLAMSPWLLHWTGFNPWFNRLPF